MLVLMILVNDKPITGNVMKIENIVEPRKAIVEYREGESFMAKCRSYGVHAGHIGKIAADDKRKDLEDILRGHAFDDLVEKYMSVAEQPAKTRIVEPELPVMMHTPKRKRTTELPTTTDEAAKHSSARKVTHPQIDGQRLLTEKLLKKARTCEDEPHKKHFEDTKSTGSRTILESNVSPTPTPVPSSSQNSSIQQDVLDSERTESEYVTQKEFKEFLKKFQSLKDRVKILEKAKSTSNKNHQPFSSPSPAVQAVSLPASPLQTISVPKAAEITKEVLHESQSSLLNGKTYEQLQDLVCHTDSLFSCVHVLMTNLFSIQYQTSHSVSGQAPYKTTKPKPKFDTRLYEAMVSIVKAKFKNISRTDITQKFQCVQKKYLLKKTQDN